MSTREMETRITELKQLRLMADELATEIDTLETEIKAEMTARDVKEMTTATYKIRWTRVTSKRLDSKALKVGLPDVYEAYAKESHSRRFSIV